MASTAVIDIDALTQPISEELPQGVDVRSDRSPTSDYYTIKDARNSARAAERSALFDDGDVDLMAPWRDVVKSAEKILGKSSKDLEVASWYTEALIRLHGFDGLRDGFALIERFLSEYWEGLYPQPDEDGIETKVAPLAGLNGDGADGTLLMPIRNAEITPEGDFGGFSFFQYQQARDADRIADEDAKAARKESLGYSISDFEQCAKSASPQWVQELVDTLVHTIASYKAINEILRSECGQDAPPASNINKLLEEVLRTTRFIYKEQLDSLAHQVSVTEADGPTGAATEIAQGEESMRTVFAPAGAIATREDALQLLEKAAKYFRAYEPHTPLAPGLERLIDWGRMTVAELMTELLPDDQSRALYSQLTGVRLDGSDSQRYVAPPVANTVNTSTKDRQEAAAPQNSDDEWNAKQEVAEAEVGW